MFIIGGDSIEDTLIGTICSIVSGSNNLKQEIVIGFANSEDGVKVSGRLNKKSNMNIGELIKNVVHSLGGEGGGHGKAGGHGAFP